MAVLTVLEKNNLINYSDFVGTVEQAAREKARFFNQTDLNATLPAWAANRAEQAKLRAFSFTIRDGGYANSDLAKKFLAKHTADVATSDRTVGSLTNTILAAGGFDTFIEQVFRDQIITLEV